ncbi:serine hydrolase domain-containing protein [Guptibacillus algicola]|uniref:serine hydrolase domain-containing protein n=1 Tax=Guptibacillus algicola TaxID=225844 RepID=UPI001CD70EB8|nr:serine hydrolase domain-containing protein [Alkalihalobacillus algicola]MCA0986553.1 beta-lactamase family protein [Alkalihalobacillus algicola]
MNGQDFKKREVDKVLDFLEQNRLFSGVVLLSEHGKPFYKRGIGKRNDREHHSYHSIFEIASISKSFTAIAIMILIEEGELTLDDHLEKFFPYLPFKDITIKNMLNHTSGLPDYMEWFETAGNWDRGTIATNKDVVQFLRNEKPAVLFQVNEKWEYCNTGYVLLAEIIEMVSEMEYGEFLAKRIFKPLNMYNTSTYSQFLDNEIENFSLGYIYDWKQNLYRLPNELDDHNYAYYLDGIKGDGGIKSTVDDLLIWERSIYDSNLLAEKTKKAMINPVLVNGSAEYCHSLHKGIGGYGFGWKIEDHTHYKKIVLHDGYWAGYCSGLISYKDYDKGIVMLNNLDFTESEYNKIPHLLTLTLERILFGGKAELHEFEKLIMPIRIK